MRRSWPRSSSRSPPQRCSCASATRGPLLEPDLVLREELDDAVLVSRHIDLVALRPVGHLPGERLLIGGEPFGNTETKTDRFADTRLDATAGLDRDRLARPNLIGGAVDPLAVDEDVAMADELSSLGARAGEAQAVDDVIQAQFELTQQFLTRCLGPPAAGIEVARQLPGGDPVKPLHLLLFSQLEEIVGIALAAAPLLPGAALLPRRIGTADAAALARNLAGPLQAEFDTGSAREFFDGTTGSHAKPIPLYTALSNLSEFDPDRYRGRDRDRLIERSTAFVVVDEIDGLRLARTRKEEPNLDPLKDRRVRPVSNAFDGGLNLIQANAGIARP